MLHKSRFRFKSLRNTYQETTRFPHGCQHFVTVSDFPDSIIYILLIRKTSQTNCDFLEPLTKTENVKASKGYVDRCRMRRMLTDVNG